MKNSWVFSAMAGVYISPIWISSNSSGSDFFYNQIDFEFFDDPQCSVRSIGQTGITVVNGKSDSNAVFQPIPSNSIDVTNPVSLNWLGVANQLQVIIASSLTNTNYIQLVFYRG